MNLFLIVPVIKIPWSLPHKHVIAGNFPFGWGREGAEIKYRRSFFFYFSPNPGVSIPVLCLPLLSDVLKALPYYQVPFPHAPPRSGPVPSARPTPSAFQDTVFSLALESLEECALLTMPLCKHLLPLTSERKVSLPPTSQTFPLACGFPFSAYPTWYSASKRSFISFNRPPWVTPFPPMVSATISVLTVHISFMHS